MSVSNKLKYTCNIMQSTCILHNSWKNSRTKQYHEVIEHEHYDNGWVKQ
jgi:hypothetical protein